MAHAPADRYPSAAALRDALRAWLDRPVSAPAAPTEPARATSVAPVAPRPTPPAAARGPVRQGGAGTSDRPRLARMPVIGALLALVGVGAVWLMVVNGPGDGGIELPGVIAGSPGGVAFPNPTPTPEPTTPPSPAPSPRPTAAITPPVVTPPPSTPPSTPGAIAATQDAPRVGEPDDAVIAFYRYVTDGRFDEAYALWSDRMKAEFPRRENLDERFANTAAIRFTQLSVASRGPDTATVQANFVETYDSGSSREFIGYWELIRVGDRWLLDWPTY